MGIQVRSSWSSLQLFASVAALVVSAAAPLPASAQAASYALSVSGSSTRAGAVALQGSTLAGAAHVFTSSATDLQQALPAGVTRVCFWLDDPGMTGAAWRCEGAPPYDFNGSVSSASTAQALPWNTAGLADGAHSITQLVTRTTGTTESVSAQFTVRNQPPAPNPPTLQSLSVGPASVTGGQGATGTVTLDVVAPSGGTTVALASDAAAAQVPASVTVPAGSRTATFAVTTSTVAAPTVATLGATFGGVQKTATLTLTVATAPTTTYALSVSGSASRSGAAPLQGSTLAGLAYVFTSSAADLQQALPAGVTRVCFWLDDPAMSGSAVRCEGAPPYDFAGSVSGASNAQALAWNTTGISDGTHSITQQVTRTTGATESVTAQFTVRNQVTTPTLPVLLSLTVNPASVTGGQGATGTVTLDVAAPGGGTSVSLTSDTGAAQVPAGVTVPAGSRTATFAIGTTAVAATTLATLAGTYDGIRRTATLAVVPASTQVPTYALSVSGSATRSGAVALQGSTLTGNAHVFTSSATDLQQALPAGVTRVCFWLDDPAMSGAAWRCEGAPPYDFAGSANSLPSSQALAWDTTGVANGAHSITQLVTRTTGVAEAHTDEFTVKNVIVVGEPTAESASKKGPYAQKTYSSGIPVSENTANPLIYYPTNGTPPYPGVVFTGGYCEVYGPRFLQWGTFLASHGFIVLFVDSAKDPCWGSKANALTEGMATLVAENDRVGSPLLGLVDTSRLAVMGHSTGGGGALDAANWNVDPRLKAAVGLTPITGDRFYPENRVPSLIIAGDQDPKGPLSLQQYESIPATTPKLLAEFALITTVMISMHHIGNTPLGTNVTDPIMARIGLSYLKVYLADDLRYRQFLVADPSMTIFRMVP